MAGITVAIIPLSQNRNPPLVAKCSSPPSPLEERPNFTFGCKGNWVYLLPFHIVVDFLRLNQNFRTKTIQYMLLYNVVDRIGSYKNMFGPIFPCMVS